MVFSSSQTSLFNSERTTSTVIVLFLMARREGAVVKGESYTRKHQSNHLLKDVRTSPTLLSK